MEVIQVRINGGVRSCIPNVGSIVSMKEWWMDDYSGHAVLNTDKKKIELCGRPGFIIKSGVVLVDSEDYEYCSDPRVVQMYLLNLWRSCHDLEEIDPPVPTMEEAVKWLREMDIPLEPQAKLKEISRQTERNLLNH